MMTRNDWNETAQGLARHVRERFSFVPRGAVPLRFIDDSAGPAHFLDDGPLVVGIFGNDNYLADLKARRVVTLVRQRLREAAVEELGFGLSHDGAAWALLAGADSRRYHTAAGKTFQRELLKIFLEDLVWKAWQAVLEEDGQPAAGAHARV